MKKLVAKLVRRHLGLVREQPPPRCFNVASGEWSLCVFCAEAFLNDQAWSPEGVNCPHCDAIGREKFLYYALLLAVSWRAGSFAPFVRGNPQLQDLSVLELSPRSNAARRAIFEKTFKSYAASDFDESLHSADFKLDLTDDASVAPHVGRFDVVLFAHVLEHIPDYEKALRNLCRLLTPTGFAILQIPLLEEAYTKVTWDEFHGDNTRVFHRFAFDILPVLQKFAPRVSTVVAAVLESVPHHQEIKPGKYAYLRRNPAIPVVRVGEPLTKVFGFGPKEYCEAFILFADKS